MLFIIFSILTAPINGEKNSSSAARLVSIRVAGRRRRIFANLSGLLGCLFSTYCLRERCAFSWSLSTCCGFFKLEQSGLKSTIDFKKANSTKSISSLSRLNRSSLMLIILSSRLESCIIPFDFCSSLPSLCSMWTAASVNNGDNGKEEEHCATPNMKRSDQELCSKTSWSEVSRVRNAWMFRVQSTVKKRRRVAIS